MRTAPDNSRGCIYYSDWSDDDGIPPLVGQLKNNGIEYSRTEMKNLAGWAGNAYLIHYKSAKTGDELVVMCIPYTYAQDGWAERYYYFPASVFYAHPHEQWWIDAYEDLKQLTHNT